MTEEIKTEEPHELKEEGKQEDTIETKYQHIDNQNDIMKRIK
jgi:hypothetical protein